MAIPFNLPSDEETEDHYRRLDQLLTDLYDVLRQILFRPRPPVDGDLDSFASLENGNLDYLYGLSGGPENLEERLLALPDLVQSALIPPPPSSYVPRPAAATRTVPRLISLPTQPSRRQEEQPHCRHWGATASPTTALGKRSLSSDVPDGAITNLPPPPPPQPQPQPQPLPRRIVERTKNGCRCPTKVADSPSKPFVRHKRWTQVGEELRTIAEDFRTTFNTNTSNSESNEQCPMELKASSLFSLLIPATIGQSVWTTVIFLVGWRILVRLR